MKHLKLDKSKTYLFLLSLIGLIVSCNPKELEISTEALSISINDQAQLTSIKDKQNNMEYLAIGHKAPLLSVQNPKDSVSQSPTSIKINRETQIIGLNFESGATVDVKYVEKEGYLTFEVISATPQEKIPMVVWGPYPTTIRETIGKVVGVVRNKDFAVGLQTLNIKTTGGFPDDNSGYVHTRTGPAYEREYGSALFAFSLDRTFERTADVWGNHFKNMPILPVEGETVVGSKIALFGCTPKNALGTIGKIEVDEGLPHPIVDGEWIKTHPERSKAYFITNFNERNFDELLAYTKKAGMNVIYHGGPFLNWGKFDLNPRQFPNGYAGMKALVDKAKTQGIKVGSHVLTSFITPNDPFITPVPNANLAITGNGVLTADINDKATEIPVSTCEFFDNEQFNWMHTVKIGNELIRYRSVTKEPPYTLIDCERGAFGTTVSTHQQGEKVGKLLDHPYKVFFPNFELQKEMVNNLTHFFNETGVSHMDFDGHEGGLATGQGMYGIEDFSDRTFRGTNHNLANGSSLMTHNYWHMSHYVNWGEPWYGGFRQSQSEYRFNNQPFLEANYLPNYLGWFSLTPKTTVADIEWMLAKGAGYNAGFALSANLPALKANPNTDKILDLIRIWEKARLSGAFDAHRKQLKDLSKEFHLEEVSDTEWKLMIFQDYDFEFEKIEVQPGQPTYAEWQFSNETGEQSFRAIIALEGEGTVSNITMEVSNYAVIKLSEQLSQGEELVIDASGKLTISDNKGRVKSERMLTGLPVVGNGSHAIQFDCEVEKGSPKVKVKIRLDGKEETVIAKG